jgi:hypothetical protein
VIAGACVTALKAFFDETFVIPNPMVASDDGQSLVSYAGSDAEQITVGGELNKLANNAALGRDMAGVHWRSDVEQALLLGKRVTIGILRDQRHTYNEPFLALRSRGSTAFRSQSSPCRWLAVALSQTRR